MPETNAQQTPQESSLGAKWLPITLTLLVFLAYSFRQAPIPAVNEPHYLGKAKHLWDAGFCAGDFFYESSNPHFVFYLLLGPFTKFCTLMQTAIIGRVLGYAILALGWSALCRSVTKSNWAGPLAAVLFVTLASIGNFSGEWMIGGIEGKVFSYGFGFWSIAMFLNRRPVTAAALLGLAISMHVIVGMWMLICGVLAVLLLKFFGRSVSEWFPEEDRRVLIIWSVVVLVVCALPGLLPAFSVLGGAEPEVVRRANYIHVFIRLKHHLDPMQFPAKAYLLYGILMATWLIGRRYVDRSREESWLHAFVWATVVVALVGWLVGARWGSVYDMPLQHFRTTLLKFYPFRLVDVMIPITVAITVSQLLIDWTRRETLPAYWYIEPSDKRGLLAFCTAFLFIMVIAVPTKDANPSRMRPRQQADWLALCEWIRENTPSDSSVVTIPNDWAFKWFAQRATYFSYKDCPQGPEEIVEWARRSREINSWGDDIPPSGYTDRDLRALHELTGADYLIAQRRGPFNVPPVYRNKTYRLYRTIPPASEVDESDFP
ncbi:hypothetical protein V22_42270 [Calycomorphotria hydatis]|uniref:DUF6798 domain-containing protein n=2 Tax=Calycomorphotria hydatis TaxID=2528027 RepID=A0A517TF07_9PLAN|nr:hypothetical protein V22_42270 [Calycomorphotria hydatis]